MKEVFIILLVIGVLLGLTALRYRKQIAGVIGMARALKEVRRAAMTGRGVSPAADVKSKTLVQCSTCGVWVPDGKAIRVRNADFCSETCLANAQS